ncbi:MAG TPA: response regulator [Planctomycetota bacterium]|nr:response regulator [Planctomycetota bacterium]
MTRDHKKKVLVVDDEPDVTELLRVILEADDLEVFTAFDGLSALKGIEEHDPDLVLLDVLMPTYDGFAVCRMIRANPQIRMIPVVLLTTARENYVLKHILEAGADDYILKSADNATIRAKVRGMLHLG